MIQFNSEFEVPCYEEDALVYYKKNAAAYVGNLIAENLGYVKTHGHHMTMQQFNALDFQAKESCDNVRYKLSFYASRIEDYHELKSNILALFATASGANMETQKQLHNIFINFESKDQQKDETTIQQAKAAL